MNVPRNSAVSGRPAATLLPWWPQRGVGHPLWLAALIVLLINDHFLKGGNVIPGCVTGKLSDFAGLIVAPVLLATVVRARRTSARFACVAAVGVGFAAVKLVPAAARGLEAALGLAHIPSRIWG